MFQEVVSSGRFASTEKFSHKRILEQLGLPFEGLSRVPGVLHEGDFLRDEPCEIQEFDSPLMPFSSTVAANERNIHKPQYDTKYFSV
jgi:hypothetical protein